MFLYYGIAILSSLIAFIAFKTKKNLDKYKWYYIVASALPFFIVSAFRYNVGTDYISYQQIFDTLSKGHDIKNMDIGFAYLCKFISELGGDFYSLIFITSLIFLGFVFYYIFSDSPYPYISTYLLFAMQYYFCSFNCIRQMCGAAILLFSLKYVEKKKLISFLICILIAYSFHSTCIVFLPVYWFDNFKIKPVYIILISIFIYIFGDRIANIINIIMANTKYESYALEGGDGRVRLSWTLIQIAIVLFTSFYYKSEKKFNILYNLQVVTMWLSFLTPNVSWIWRIQWTFGLAGIVFLPYTISKSKYKGNKYIYSLVIIVCFSIYIYFSTVLGSKHDVLPYLTYLTNNIF